MQSSRSRTVLVTGYSTAPAGTSMHALLGHCGVVLEVDPESHEILGADFTVVTRLAGEFLQRMCVGRNLLTEWREISDDLKRSYLAPSASAMVIALRAAAQRYADSVGHAGTFDERARD